jgi:PLP dependent protein
MDILMSIIDNFRQIQDSIHTAALSCGRDPSSIRIVAVSKTFPFEDINEAIREGITLFGENRIQEARKSF